MARVLVVGPHPDDQELGMGGTIIRLAEQGHDVLLLDMTNGEPTPLGSPEQREKEWTAAAEIMGVERRLISLKNREVEHTLPARHLVAGVIREHQAEIVFTPYPEDAHPDHRATTRIVEDARFDAKLRKANLPGGRSKRIAESASRCAPVRAYALLDTGYRVPAPDVTVERSIGCLAARALRFAAVRVLPAPRKRRFAVRQFDLHTAKRLRALPSGTVSVLHIWNWLPQTVAVVRRWHPQAVVIRDVSIAREYDFEWGEDIRAENALVDVFLSPSPYASAELYSWGIASDKVQEIPFGVDADRFRPATSKGDGARAFESPGPVRFAYAGAVSGRKGVPELLRVWRDLALPDAELHLYGTVKPEIEPELNGLSGVHAHGFTDITVELPRNDIFVFPSHREGSAKAVYEALACGLPVITTPNAGSIVRHGREGLIIEAGNEAALAAAVGTLYEDGALRRRMSVAARARAEEFPWNRYARRVWELYEQTAKLRDAPSTIDSGTAEQPERQRR
jgi:LmbE family N-acetylglucosaminyl deacetylase